MDAKQLEAVERWNLLLAGVLLVLASIFFPADVAIGVGVGGVLSCANFTAIRRIWQAVARAEGGRRSRLQVLIMVKMMAMMFLVVLAIRFLPLSPAALAVGLSVFLVSIAIESVRFALRPEGNSHG